MSDTATSSFPKIAKNFMDENFLLETPISQYLYHQVAKKMPIIDYHCHIHPEEIALDKKFHNITQVWLGGDHYKWRLMRASGVDEKYITGSASDQEKFFKFAEILPGAMGNPVYHWCHLELQRFFDFHVPLNIHTAQSVWDICNAKLQSADFSSRNLILKSNVEIICTTDDPVDTLEHHQTIARDSTFNVKVFPAWRPDKALNIEKKDFLTYLTTLEIVSHQKITGFSHLKQALQQRLTYFAQNHCSLSDHGLDYVMFEPATEAEIEHIFQKALLQAELSAKEIRQYKTAFMLFMGQEYHKRNWVMQLHYGCKRNNNVNQFTVLGPDTGYDCINNNASASELADFLAYLDQTNQLPKTIVYSLNPQDNAMIVSIINCFQSASAKGKIQHGSAWWFNDHKSGMENQLITLASLGYLGTFIGMLTDSRSFLSYPRHEYFRRILCNVVGKWVEDGEYPADIPALEKLIRDISYYNSQSYFGWDKDK